MFTRRHYEIIAHHISKVQDLAIRRDVAAVLATAFIVNNPRFNRERFMRACNV